MTKLSKEVKQVNHKLSLEELADYSEQNAQLNIQIEETKQEGKNIQSQYTNRVKILESKRLEVSQNILSKKFLKLTSS